MTCLAAHVTVRFAGSTIIDVHDVLPGASCRIGRTRDAHIAIDVSPFTLVESTAHGFIVRRAAGAPALSLERDIPLAIVFGAVDVTVELVTHAPTPVPRREVERRPYAFGAGSLVAHVGLLLLATWLAVPEDTSVPASETSKRRPARIARFAIEAQTTKRDETKPPAETPITVDDTPTKDPKLDEPSGATIPSLPLQETPNGVGKQVTPTPQSVESPGDHIANERAFDPDSNPAFDSVKVGDYTTVSTGKGGGEQYELAGANGKRKPLIVVSCDSSSCVVIGGDSANDVRTALQARLPEIVACYEKHSASAGKKVELDFGIDHAGKVDELSVGGVGDYDQCVAKIINSLEFGK